MIFDKPMWEFKIPADHVPSDHPSLVEVEIVPATGAVRRRKLVAPTQFIGFLHDMGNCIRGSLSDTGLSVMVEEDADTKRWYLCYSVASEFDTDLWYYTMSTLPRWLEV